jgi:hypothetical protein
MHHHEMLDLVVDGKARGISRNLVTGEIEHSAHAVVVMEDMETCFLVN